MKIDCPTCVAGGKVTEDDPSRLEVNPKLYVTLERDDDGKIVASVYGVEWETAEVTCDHSGHRIAGGGLDSQVAAALSALEDVLTGQEARA